MLVLWVLVAARPVLTVLLEEALEGGQVSRLGLIWCRRACMQARQSTDQSACMGRHRVCAATLPSSPSAPVPLRTPAAFLDTPPFAASTALAPAGLGGLLLGPALALSI